jgi:uncharacterized protein (TIGR02594 family)
MERDYGGSVSVMQKENKMITRRTIAIGLVAYPTLFNVRCAVAQTVEPTEDEFIQLTFPPIEALDAPEPFGFKPASQAQKDKAKEIEGATPTGPHPIDIAQSFVDRFYERDPEAISQWPAPASWNPLVVDFFSATNLKANNDMIAWCAAFANWCIDRNGRNGTESASSQSFLTSRYFRQTTTPNPGDLAVFTCYDRTTGKSLGLGHVTFFKGQAGFNRINVVAGNQSKDGHSSIISERTFPTSNTEVKRHVGNEYVACTMRLNTYLSVI